MISKKILIIEDEPSLRGALVKKINESGYSVLEAVDGETGLELCLKEHPDLVLLDVIMPKMDGMTMLGKLREDEWGKTAKVIMLTNLNDAEEIEKSMEKGVYDYLVKTDWKIKDIIEKIEERLK